MRRIGAIALTAALLAACSGSGSHDATEKRIEQPLGTTTTMRRDCTAPPTTSPVRHLTSRTGSAWVWIESAARPRIRVGYLVKVVWRMTGTGDPQTLLSDPYGHPTKLSFGPERHQVSTFDHPGAEYGTGFTPTVPGCWRIGMRRGAVEAWLSLAVDR